MNNEGDLDFAAEKKLHPTAEQMEEIAEKIRKELIEHIKDQQSSFISAPDCRDKYEEEENNIHRLTSLQIFFQNLKKHLFTVPFLFLYISQLTGG